MSSELPQPVQRHVDMARSMPMVEASRLPLDDQRRILTAEIVNDELNFLFQESWVISKIKRPFNTIADKGCLFLQVSAKMFDHLVAKTLKEEDNIVITNAHRLRGLAKWIDVGGSSLAQSFVPAFAMTAGLAAGYFLLIDPE